MAITPALIVHVSAGSLAILSGAVAVFARKGDNLHRVSGTVFFLAMLTMSAFATYLAVSLQQTGNAVAGPFVFYLVGTAWVTVRRAEPTVGLFDYGALIMGSGVAAALLFFGIQGIYGTGFVDRAPAQAIIIMGGVAALAAVLDLKVIRQGGISGAPRIARHLWRMCYALFIAAGSFFLGQQKVMPKFMHGAPIFYVLALAPLVLMAFWLLRVRFSNQFKTAAIVP